MLDRVSDATSGGKLPTDAVRASPGHSAPADVSVPERYEQLLRTLARAEHEFGEADGGAPSRSLTDAASIVFDLLYALDFRRGGEMVPRLAALYGYIGNELLDVSRTGDKQQLGHIRDMIVTLRQSWRDGEAAA